MKSILCSVLLFCIAFASPLLADEVITNVMSPVVSYQYFNDLGSEALTNGGIMSPVASYQYFDSLGGANVMYQNSASVSYFFNVPSGGNAFTLTGRVVDTAGVPVGGATVTVSVLETTQTSTTTAADGNYQIPALPQGVYVFTAAKSGYARDRRVVSFTGGTVRQDFRLVPLVASPVVNPVTTPPPFVPPAPTDIEGSTLLVFDGSQFVPDTTPTKLDAKKMTVVLTHGWNSSPSFWAVGMATTLKNKGLLPFVNIVAWDWNVAANQLLPPEEKTPKQGVALGKALYQTFGSGYATNVHFLGHSLGALVNAAAANYLHGYASGRQERASPVWNSSLTHMTLFDEAELARVVGKEVFFDLANGVVTGDGVRLALAAAETVAGWKLPLPANSAWADSYISLVGVYHSDALNVCLERAIPLTSSFQEAHSYPQRWYSNSIDRSSATTLGFQRAFEYRLVPGAVQNSFPPLESDFSLGMAYHQVAGATDELALEFVPPLRFYECFAPAVGVTAAIAANYMADGAVAIGRSVGDAVVDVVDTAAVSVYRGVNSVVDEAETAGRKVIDLLSRSTIRITLRVGQAPRISLMSRRTADGSMPTNAPAYAWLPLAVPADAVLMNFEFTVTGDGKDDSVVFGINGTNLFSLETKFLADGEAAASRLIDVTSYAGTTNEFFFGLLGGSSTNCTVQIQNIKFFTLASPQLQVARVNGTPAVSWPSTLSGFVLESATTLGATNWTAVSNAPALFGGTFTLTNTGPESARFYRLRK